MPDCILHRTIGGSLRCLACRIVLLSAMLCSVAMTGTARAGDKIEPFFASFTVHEGNGAGWSDVDVVLDFVMHNDEPGSLIGSKFLCPQDIDNLTVTDGQDRRLPHTVNEYPRKRVVWDYGPPRNNTRRVRMAFTMQKAVEHTEEASTLSIDWLGGWTIAVLQAEMLIVLPADITPQGILSAVPSGYALSSAAGRTELRYVFDELNAGAVNVVFTQPRPPAPVTPQPAGTSYELKDLRFGERGPLAYRLVFDLSGVPPYEVVHQADTAEVTIAWSAPLTIGRKAMQKKPDTGDFITGLRWTRSGDGTMTCVIGLHKNVTEINHGALNNPSRIYIDFMRQAAAAIEPPPGETITETPLPADDNATAPAADEPESPMPRHEELTPAPAPQEPPPDTSDLILLELPIQQKIDFLRAGKLLDDKEYRNALDAYERFLDIYPDSPVREEVVFAIATGYYRLTEEKTSEYYASAQSQLKRALSAYPHSDHAPGALFMIAELYRSRSLFIEAKSQYEIFSARFPDDPLTSDARFWTAECLYQMENIPEALQLFLEFVEAHPAHRHIKRAAFRIADCYVKLRDFDRAEYYYDKALKRWPDFGALEVDVLNNIALTYYYKGMFKKAREIFFISFNVYPGQPERPRLLRFAGDAYQWEGDMQKALTLYGLLMELYPEDEESALGAMRAADLGVNVAGLTSRMVSFQGFDPYQSPEGTYRWIIQNTRTPALLTEALYKLGFTLAQKGDYGEAVHYFKKAMFQQDHSIYYKRAYEHIQRIIARMIHEADEHRDAFGVVDLYSKHEDPFLLAVDDCMLYYKVAAAYADIGLSSFAEPLLRRVIDSKSAEEQCRQLCTIRLCQIDLQRGSIAAARDCLRTVVYGSNGLAPESLALARHLLGDAYYAAHNYAGAVDMYSSAITSDHGDNRNALSLFRLGESLGTTGYYLNAIRVLQDFIGSSAVRNGGLQELSAYARQAQIMIADYMYEKKMYAASVTQYREVIMRDDDSDLAVWAHLRMAGGLHATGKERQAAETYARAAAVWPFTHFGRYARAKLAGLEWQASIKNEIDQFM